MTLKSQISQLFSSKSFRYFLGASLSFLTIYLAFRDVDFKEVGQAIASADLGLLGLALVSVAINTMAKVVRWQVLFGREGQGLPFSKLTLSLLSGQLLNIIYPARVGDLSRVYVIGGLGPGRVFTLGTIVIEKLLDMLSYLLLFILVLIMLPLPDWVRNSVYTLSALVLIASVGVILFSIRPVWLMGRVEWFLNWLPERIGAYLLNRLHSGLSSLEILKNRQSLLRMAFWSILVWGSAILNIYLVLLAMKIYLPWTASLLILVVLQAGITLPSVPGRFGIFEYSCILALSLFAIGQSGALSFGIVLHAVVFFPVILLGLLSSWALGLDHKNVITVLQMTENQLISPENQG